MLRLSKGRSRISNEWCDMAQELTPFAIFGAQPRFRINGEKLEAAYRQAIMKVHPDRFADRPAAERRVAEQWTSRINEAFETLGSPSKRAAWLCAAAGHPIEAETNTSMPADFLMEQIEWREALEAGRGAEARERAESTRTELLEGLGRAIDDEANWARAVDLTRRLLFVERFLMEADAARKAERLAD